MIYYKSKTGEVYAYETEKKRQEWGAPDLVELTKKETEAHLKPQPTRDQLAERVRAERDAKIEAVRWRIERAKDEKDLGITLTEPLEPLLRYVQVLRDVPQQAGFPEKVEWPEL